MKKVQNLRKCWLLVILAILEIFLFFSNFKKGTFLVGWDNLFPELNFAENFKRSFFTTWQEYRGLGLLDGMSYLANLPHYFFIYLLSFILPLNVLRYLFVFLMHFLGGAGIYLLSGRLFKNKIASLAASIFYIFNLATTQAFYVPFELFLVHFAFLPILLYSCWRFLESGLKKDLIIFFLLSVLSWPQAHVPTLFIVYFGALMVFTLLHSGGGLKKKIVIVLTTLVVNAPWMFPYVYSTVNNAQIISNSKVNVASSTDIFLKNKAFGNFTNTVLLKGFEMDTVELQPDKSSGFIMPNWRNHSDNIFFKIVGFGFLGIALTGLLLVLVKRQRDIYPAVALFIISFVMLGQDIPILNLIPQFLNKHVPLFKQAFRFTFTKFSLLFAFSFSILLGNGFRWFLEMKVKLIKFILPTLFLSAMVFYSWPAWGGNFLYDNLRLKIPDEYFETINFFKNSDKNTRVATLPQPSFWGWTYTSWNLRGSGFMWFGISQPTLDGAFLPWSRENENYYWEMSYALYSKNRQLFDKVLEKYQINWLLVDGNVINPGSSKALFLEELEEILGNKQDEMSNIRYELEATFGKVKIYKVNLETPVKDFVWIAKDLPVVNGYEWGNYDKAYSDIGNYISQNVQLPTINDKTNSKQTQNTKYKIQDTTYDVYYPFRSLFTGRKTDELDVEIEDLGEKIVFKKKLPKEVFGYFPVLPEGYEGKELPEVDKETYEEKFFLPRVGIEENSTGEIKIEVEFPKVKGILGLEIDPAKKDMQAKNCSQFGMGWVQNTKRQTQSGEVLVLEAEDANNCSASFWLPDLPNKYAYLISAESRNIAGKSLLFWVENLTNRKADLELYLDSAKSAKSLLASKSYLVQPPMAEDGLGYSLHFDSISIGRQKTINELGKITIYPIPYRFLTSLKLINPSYQRVDLEKLKDLPGQVEVEHPNPAFYEVRIDGEVGKNGVLVLSQAYHKGWAGYLVNQDLAKNKNSFLIHFFPFLFGKRLEQVKVNNWENGWLLDNIGVSDRIILVFLPQYLEYVGFCFLIGVLVWLAMKKEKLVALGEKTKRE